MNDNDLYDALYAACLEAAERMGPALAELSCLAAWKATPASEDLPLAA